jgi:hypothetical protein
MKEFNLGRVAGLQLMLTPPLLVGSLGLAVASGLALAWLHFTPGACVVGALLVVLFHWLSGLAHQVGHAWAARRVGHPMLGIRVGRLGLLGTSLYPADEPALPAEVHMRRALGGPAASLTVTLLAAAAAWGLAHTDANLLWCVAVWVCFENAAVFTLGALLPLPFTDGGTLLHWWRSRKTEL